MLEMLRRGALGLFAKAILAIVLLGFVLWGVGDQVRRQGTSEVATVGSKSITPEAFSQAFRAETDRLTQAYRRPISAEQARAFGLDRQALQRLVETATYDNVIQDLRLSISERSIVDAVRTAPDFQTADGKFDRLGFNQYLRQAQLTEQGYIRRRREDLPRAMLLSTLGRDFPAPRAYVDLLHGHLEEQRVVEVVTFEPAKLVTVPAPAADKVRAYYDANKGQYVAPEKRKVSFIIMSRDVVAKMVEVTDADVLARYESEKATAHTVVERRKILQFPFPNTAAAEAALTEMKKARTFADALVTLGLKEADFDLGLKLKGEVLDPAIGEAAFTAKLNEPVIVSGQFGAFVVRVSEIDAARVKPLAEVADVIRANLVADRVAREVEALHTRIDDLRSGGVSLKVAAEQVKLPYLEVDALEKSGTGADGKPAIAHPDAPRIVLAAFGGAQGVETDAIELADKGFAWLDVMSVTPPVQKQFETVEAEVRAAFIAAETAREASLMTQRYVERLKKGELTYQAFAAEVKAKIVRTPTPVTRLAAPDGISRNAIAQAFAIAPGDFAAATAAEGDGRAIVRVVTIHQAAAATQPQLDRLTGLLKEGFGNDALTTYQAAIRQRYPVRVNMEAMKAATGARE